MSSSRRLAKCRDAANLEGACACTEPSEKHTAISASEDLAFSRPNRNTSIRKRPPTFTLLVEGRTDYKTHCAFLQDVHHKVLHTGREKSDWQVILTLPLVLLCLVRNLLCCHIFRPLHIHLQKMHTNPMQNFDHDHRHSSSSQSGNRRCTDAKQFRDQVADHWKRLVDESPLVTTPIWKTSGIP